MKPIEFKEQNVVLAKDQPQYMPLPVHVMDTPEREIISCWKLTEEERVELLSTGEIWVCQLTFGGPLQPQRLTTSKEDMFGKEYLESLKK